MLQRSTSAAAFRTALARAAGDDPAVLAVLFWRAASAVRYRPARQDRRHTHPPATELRRAIRHLEQQLFRARERLDRTEARPFRRRRFSSVVWIAAGVAVAFFAASVMLPTTPSTVVLPRADAFATAAGMRHVAVVSDITGDHIDTTTAPKPRMRAGTPTAAAAGVQRQAAQPRLTAASWRRTQRRGAAIFAGGTRSIPWALATR
jgi:hypothetical protein